MFSLDDMEEKQDLLEEISQAKGAHPTHQSTDQKIKHAKTQEKRRSVRTAIYTTDLGSLVYGPLALGGAQYTLAANLFLNGLHLPNGQDLGSAYIENFGAACNIAVIEGPAPNGRIITYVKFNKAKHVVFADYTSSCCLIATAQDTGLVAVTLMSGRRSAPSSAQGI